MARLGTFWREGLRGGRPPSADATRAKDWVRAALSLPEDATVSINEIVCADPGCPGTETIVLVMVPGQRTRAHKITRPLAEVTEADVRAALLGG